MNTVALILAAAPAATTEFNAAGELVRVIFSLVGVIAIILVAGWLTRRIQRRRPAGGGRRIHCVESFAVGTRDRLLLLDADGKRMLIGIGATGMRTLHVYDGTVPDDDRPQVPGPAKPVFADMLARLRPRT